MLRERGARNFAALCCVLKVFVECLHAVSCRASLLLGSVRSQSQQRAPRELVHVPLASQCNFDDTLSYERLNNLTLPCVVQHEARLVVGFAHRLGCGVVE